MQDREQRGQDEHDGGHPLQRRSLALDGVPEHVDAEPQRLGALSPSNSRMPGALLHLTLLRGSQAA